MPAPAATYWSYWGLREAPFRVAPDSPFYHLSITHEEALARLHFLVENKRRVGLLTGESGSGKTLALTRFVDELRRAGTLAALIPTLAAGPDELLTSLMTGLLISPVQGESPARCWARIADRLRERRYQQVPTVFAFDDVDRTNPESVALIERLLQLDVSPDLQLTVILTADSQGETKLSPQLLDQVELRVELECWSAEETAEYVEQALVKAGRRDALFEPSALERLHSLAAGRPRRVSRLADLALLAAAGQERHSIDAQIIDNVARELIATPTLVGSRRG